MTATFALLVSLAPAQQMWNATNQQQLLAAIAAATPGDVIQLAATGTFDVFTLNKGLTLRGPANIPFRTGQLVVVNVPSGQVAQLVDLAFQNVPTGQFFTNYAVVQVHGTARLEGCSSFSVGLVDANAVIERCQFTLGSTNSIASVHESTMQGPNAAPYPFGVPGGPGLVASGSGSLHISTSSIIGGWGSANTHGPPVPPAFGMQTGVPTWITDSTITGGVSNSVVPGSSGLVVTSATTFTARCTITAGVDIAGNPAPAFTGNVVADPTLLGVTMTPLARGQGASIAVQADQPGVPLAMLASIGLNDPLLLPFVTQPLLFGDAPVLVAVRPADRNGQLVVGWQVLPDPSFENVSVSFVGVGLGGAGIQITPTAGGLIR